MRLRDIRRTHGQHGAARDDLLWRINRIGELGLDSAARLSAFRDVVEAFCPSHFEFRPDYSACTVTPQQGGIVLLTGELWASGQRAAHFQRVLAVGRRTAYHEYFRTHGDFKGTALAPVVLRQSFMYFDRVGIDRAVVHAGLETGVYYWASAGFDFQHDHERQAVKAHFQTMLAVLGRNIDITNLNAAYQLANVGRVTDEKTSFKEMAEALGRLTGTTPVQAFTEQAAKNNLAYDQQLPLGKAIFLIYPRLWWGELNLDPGAGQRTLFETWASTRIRLTAR